MNYQKFKDSLHFIVFMLRDYRKSEDRNSDLGFHRKMNSESGFPSNMEYDRQTSYTAFPNEYEREINGRNKPNKNRSG